jgi:hypothetical protein
MLVGLGDIFQWVENTIAEVAVKPVQVESTPKDTPYEAAGKQDNSSEGEPALDEDMPSVFDPSFSEVPDDELDTNE